MKLALIGDYDPAVVAHQAAPLAAEYAAAALSITVDTSWIRSVEVATRALDDFDAVWFVPLSPYEDPAAMVAAIEFVRRNDIPFLGTCAGYQHAVLEYARNELGYAEAESIEDNPATKMALIGALSCRLADATDAINIQPDSQVGRIYRFERIIEEYNCGFGVNPEYLHIFEPGELRFCGFDDHGDPRIFELPGKRFYVGTAFQPERSAFQHLAHPLITEFLKAAL